MFLSFWKYLLFKFKENKKDLLSFFHLPSLQLSQFSKVNPPNLNPFLLFTNNKFGFIPSHNLWNISNDSPSFVSLYNNSAFIILFGSIQFFNKIFSLIFSFIISLFKFVIILFSSFVFDMRLNDISFTFLLGSSIIKFKEFSFSFSFIFKKWQFKYNK